jgi:hypothetical protein
VSSQLLSGQPTPVFYSTDSKEMVEIPIPAYLSKDGWLCGLAPRKAEGSGYAQSIYCHNMGIHSVMEIGAECDRDTTTPVVAASTLRTDRTPNTGIQFMVGCMAKN